jgi:drug/metabolite transporter (DMT)-like permease
MNPSDERPHVQPPSTWAIVLAFVIIYISWGTTYYATSVAMKQETMPPALFGGLRLLLAGNILLLYQLVCGQSLRLSWRDATRVFLISCFLFLAGNLLINIGQKKVESGVSAILIATTPLWMGVFGAFWPQGEQLSWRGWLGLLIGFVGIVVTMLPQLADHMQVMNDYYPLLILGSAACWAIGSLASRHMALHIPHLTSAGFQMVFGGLSQVALGTALGEWQQKSLEEINERVIGTFLYLLIFGSLAGFVAFNWLLGHVPVAKVGTYAYVNPVIALLVGCSLGETAFRFSLALGIAIVLAGVYLVRGDHRPTEEIEMEPD